MTDTPRSSPNPEWTLGSACPSPVESMLEFDVAALTQNESYKFLIGSIVPRPIALVSTVNSDGQGNLAPFSFFNAVSTRPLCVSVSVTRRTNGEKKDTLKNIEATGELVINTVAEWMIEPVNHCSADYPHGVDEMQKVGLTPIASTQVKPPRVKESPVQLECRLRQLVEVGDGSAGSATLIIAEVVRIHVHEKAYSNGRILLKEILPISRLAGDSYGLTPETFDIARPKLT